jgi:hypothetical protein
MSIFLSHGSGGVACLRSCCLATVLALWVWNGVHSASYVQLRSYLEKKKQRLRSRKQITAVGDLPRWLRDTPLPAKVGTHFENKRRSLGRYSSLTD